MNFSLNVSSTEVCQMCIDGWCELAGTVKQHGITYSRGQAPCKWCEEGRRRYARMVELRQRPETDFDAVDVIVPEKDPRPFKPDADFLRMRERDFGTPREVLWNLFPRRIWPPEWPEIHEDAGVVKAIERTETDAAVERKRKLLQDLEAQFETPEAKAEIERKKRLAQQALAAGTGTVELPPDPFNPPVTDDDLPF